MSLTNDLDQVDYFPIRILSEQTGVNSVTLRAWERRYGLLKPFRTEKGHRLYQPQDVDRVKKIL
ncbi:MAG: MerR family transcriptional regulator, partial [Pseudomonadota bacterium]|nr:MerR family transcriptional regulator [Pseudomonadota bacterium]